MTEHEVDRPQIGDRIRFELADGEKVEAMAVKEETDGMIFCTVDYLDKRYPMNLGAYNAGGYEASDLRKILNTGILDRFPDNLRREIAPFANGDLLRIPTEMEMFGETRSGEEEPAEVTQWELMKDRRNREAYRKGVWGWGWLQNVSAVSVTGFVGVDGDGRTVALYPSQSNGVRLVFKLKDDVSKDE